MGLTVSTNNAANNALTYLNRTTRSLSTTFQHLSSGMRISSAADDAAGMGVAENLDALGKGLRQAMRNTNDGVSVVEVASSASSEVGNIVKRMRELAVQSASGTLATQERTYVETEFKELSKEVDRIANGTNFNGVNLTDGVLTTLSVQVGVSNTANDTISLTLGDLHATTLGVDTGAMDLSTATGASSALAVLDTALDTINGYQANYGASQSRLESATRSLETYTEKISGAKSRIQDADFAFESAEMSKGQILQQSGLAVLGQANQLNAGVTRLLG